MPSGMADVADDGLRRRLRVAWASASSTEAAATLRARLTQRRADEIARILIVIDDENIQMSRASVLRVRGHGIRGAERRLSDNGARAQHREAQRERRALALPLALQRRQCRRASPRDDARAQARCRDPPCARDGDEAPCRKRSNTCGSSSAAMPMPVSFTRSTASEPSASQRNIDAPALRA